MTAIAKAVTLEEAQAAAAYFSALKPKANIKVIETDTVPITEIARVFYVVSKNRGSEPIGQRIVEVPDDPAQFEHRDTRSQFTAYVPKGSIARGEALAKEGAGVTTACITCHGPDLKGVASVPGIAGRSPSYLVRQLYDFQRRKHERTDGGCGGKAVAGRHDRARSVCLIAETLSETLENAVRPCPSGTAPAGHRPVRRRALFRTAQPKPKVGEFAPAWSLARARWKGYAPSSSGISKNAALQGTSDCLGGQHG
jgi:cytochrome c553